ncbi:MAG: VWA domain-containing protein [Verrucomicrobiota bacterium]
MSVTAIVYQTPEMLHWLWALPVLVAILIYAIQKRQQSLGRLLDPALRERLAGAVDPVRRRAKEVLLLLALLFVVLALGRPGWNPQPKLVKREGRDVVFLLDVSKSMLAEDMAPNRLERAKLAIQDAVEELTGDRVGLVIFAGGSVVKCPLTLDYGFFRMMLNEVTTDSIARGGTLIGDALRKVVTDVFDDEVKEYKDVILITDGEDHDSFPVQAAEVAGETGIRLIAIGLGDENEGRRIPITTDDGRRTFMQYRGQEIWSRLDANSLRQMVNATPGGKYLNVSTGTIDLGEVYQQLIAVAERKELESKTVNRYEDKFQIFLAFALVLLGAEWLVSERGRR